MKQIVIAQRGWVFVGDVERTENEVVIKNAKNIRRWGTSRGLGELAQNGPQPNTVLDDYGTARMQAVVATLDCEESKWNAR